MRGVAMGGVLVHKTVVLPLSLISTSEGQVARPGARELARVSSTLAVDSNSLGIKEVRCSRVAALSRAVLRFREAMASREALGFKEVIKVVLMVVSRVTAASRGTESTPEMSVVCSGEDVVGAEPPSPRVVVQLCARTASPTEVCAASVVSPVSVRATSTAPVTTRGSPVVSPSTPRGQPIVSAGHGGLTHSSPTGRRPSVESPVLVSAPLATATAPVTPGGSPVVSPSMPRGQPLVSGGHGGMTPSPTGRRPSVAEVMAYGGITDPSLAGFRSSERVCAQANADASQLERAMQLAQRRDEPHLPGTILNAKHSILEFTDDEVVHRASRLGVSLGVSASEVAMSVSTIKNLETSRNLVILNNSLSSTIKPQICPRI
ncbi:hypothetical protein ACQ4PT_060232 [Festuca glaucescens]